MEEYWCGDDGGRLFWHVYGREVAVFIHGDEVCEVAVVFGILLVWWMCHDVTVGVQHVSICLQARRLHGLPAWHVVVY